MLLEALPGDLWAIPGATLDFLDLPLGSHTWTSPRARQSLGDQNPNNVYVDVITLLFMCYCCSFHCEAVE